MKRAVITGLGIVSPLGNNLAETLASLLETRSGIKFQDAYAEMGLRSHIAGSIEIDVDGMIDRYQSQFSDLKVLLTGGDFQLFDKGLKNSIFADPDLVLKGLNEILDYNEAIS